MLWLLCRTSCKIIAGAARRAHSARRTPSCARRRGQLRPCWPRSDRVTALERGRALDSRAIYYFGRHLRPPGGDHPHPPNPFSQPHCAGRPESSLGGRVAGSAAMANGGRRARGAQAAPSSSSTFEVEAITNVRFAGRQNVEYLVQWKVPPGANPDDYEPTWEAEDNLEGCEDALRDFCVEWTRQYEAALKVCPRPPAQFSLPRIAPSATLTAFTPQAAKEKKEPLPMLNLPYCHADPFPEEPTGIEGTASRASPATRTTRTTRTSRCGTTRRSSAISRSCASAPSRMSPRASASSTRATSEGHGVRRAAPLGQPWILISRARLAPCLNVRTREGI